MSIPACDAHLKDYDKCNGHYGQEAKRVWKQFNRTIHVGYEGSCHQFVPVACRVPVCSSEGAEQEQSTDSVYVSSGTSKVVAEDEEYCCTEASDDDDQIVDRGTNRYAYDWR